MYDAFIKKGDKVNRGQILGIIKTIKVFNEIKSDIEGTIVGILIENSSPVKHD